MRLGIISDTHDKYADITLAVNVFKEHGCTTVFHAGDFDSLKAFQMFQDNSFGLFYAKGNHDFHIPAQSDEIEKVLSVSKIFILHSPYTRNNRQQILLNDRVDSGEYNLIIYGHLHYLNFRQPDIENHTISINPGGFYHFDMRTFCIYDVEQLQLEVFFKFNGSFVVILIYQILVSSFIPKICDDDAACAFLWRMGSINTTIFIQKKNNRKQWLATAF